MQVETKRTESENTDLSESHVVQATAENIFTRTKLLSLEEKVRLVDSDPGP